MVDKHCSKIPSFQDVEDVIKVVDMLMTWTNDSYWMNAYYHYVNEKQLNS